MVALVVGAIAAQVMGAIASVVTAGFIVAFSSHATTAELETVAREAASSFAALAAAGLGVGSMLLTVSVAAGWAVGARAVDTLGLRRAPASVAVAATLGTLGLGPTADLVMTWFSGLFPNLTWGTIPELNAIARGTPIWMLWPVLALAPGFCEEVFFRGMLQRAFGRGIAAVFVSAIAFALIHLDPHHVVGVLPLGFWLAWVAARADSTWPTIVAHIANNTLAVVATQIPELDRGYGGTQGAMPWHWVPAGLAVTAVCALLVVLATRGYSRDR
ncbi:MAG: CPBP family intramembrane metalloprotease [Deltaproteobacteria bacterium]|nr:CPBP family intramembrane metalloprotease [Deltaproteobacteria bacterium]